MSAQSTFTVIGTVTDSMGEPLIGATTVVINPMDSTMVTFGITNTDGQFYLPQLRLESENTLQITFIGHGSFQQKIIAPIGESVLDMGVIKLSPDNQFLEEIIVKAQHIPVVINGDTIEYNAAAYKVRGNDVIEDLLRQLPGVEVLPSGDIRVQGETVTQVLVDGKEFFGDDPQMATKNLPADIVEKVAVFDDQTDESKFSGIDDGQDIKTINIKLKDDKKNGVFGKMTGGVGTTDRYMAKANINRFNPSLQATWIGNMNNINDLNFSVFDPNPMAGFEGAMVIGRDEQNGPGITGDNKAISSGANFNYDFSKDLKIRSSYYYKNTRNNLLESSITENNLGSQNFINSTESDSELKNSGHNIRVSMEYDIDSSSELRIRNRLTIDKNRDVINSSLVNRELNQIPISEATRNNSSQNNFWNVEGAINYRRRLKKAGRTLRSSFNYQINASDENWYVDNTVQSQNSKQQQYSNQKEYDLSGMMYYTAPMGKGYYFNIGSGISVVTGDFEKDFFDLIDQTEVKNRDLSGLFKKEYSTFQIGSSVRKSGTAGGYDIGINYTTAELNRPKGIKERFHYLLPRFRMNKEWEIINFNLGYSAIIEEPSLQQLQNILDNRNPFSSYSGNPNLIPTYTHNINVNFFSYDQFSFQSIHGFINSRYIKNAITFARTIDENLAIHLQPINVGYNWGNNIQLNYGRPTPFFRKAKFEFNYNYDYNQGIIWINDVSNTNNRTSSGLRLKIDNRKKDRFDIAITGGINYTNSKFSKTESFDIQYFTKSLRIYFDYNISDVLSFGSEYSGQFYSQESFSTNDNLQLWNANISWLIGENSRWSIDFEVNDIFNAGLGVYRSPDLGGITETQSNQLGRYGMFQLSYNISDFKPRGRQLGF